MFLFLNSNIAIAIKKNIPTLIGLVAIEIDVEIDETGTKDTVDFEEVETRVGEQRTSYPGLQNLKDPPIIVERILRSKKLLRGVERGLPDKMIKSANFPFSILPFSCSWNVP